jgi:hypothetical protein
MRDVGGGDCGLTKDNEEDKVQLRTFWTRRETLVAVPAWQTSKLSTGGDSSTARQKRIRGGQLAGALFVALAFAVLQLALATAAAADTGTCLGTGFETVATDRPSYQGGETAYVTGTGYAPGCDVVIRITRPDAVIETATVTTDPLSGTLSYDYLLPGPPNISGDFLLEALGLDNAVLASTMFADAPKLDADVAPAWVPTATSTKFSTLVRNTSTSAGDVFRNVRITLPANYSLVAGSATATFSDGTWNAPAISGQTVRVSTTNDNAGNSIPMGGWVRIDFTATTPGANQSGAAALWQFDTWSNSAGSLNLANDDPAIAVGINTSSTASVSFRDGTASDNAITPTLTNGIATTLRLRVTHTLGAGSKYVAVAVPTCFSSPTAVSTTVSTGGNGSYTINVDDNFIRLPGGSIPGTPGFLTIQFTTTPNCTGGSYGFPVAPNENQNNPASGTNQSVKTDPAFANLNVNTAPTVAFTTAPATANEGETKTYNFSITDPDRRSA